MPLSHVPMAAPLSRMPDGTIKQVNPFTGTQVWTVPGRGHRPLGARTAAPGAVDHDADGRHCALCHLRYLETPPEKSRLVRLPRAAAGLAGSPGRVHGAHSAVPDPAGAVDVMADGVATDGARWRTVRGVPAERLFDDVAEFRRIPNLFEILSFTYWQANYGYDLGPDQAAAMREYLDSRTGREHVLAISRTRLLAGGMTPQEWAALPDEGRLSPARAFFGGSHELIVARRHFTDDAETDDALASSGALTPEEHYRYTAFTVDALRSIYATNRYARYVAVFQNWLKPAGASFDHLHKQLAAIDERGVQVELELERLRGNPNIYNEMAVDYAGYQNLVIAENDHAVAFAGFGHRYPTLEVYSKSTASAPWEHSPEEMRGVSDLLHACHAATGAAVSCNEEWHHRPADVDVPMPWRIVLKWRVSTLAGFEGGTRIYLNTIDPWTQRDRVVPRLYALRSEGRIAPVRVATECSCTPNSLRYNARR